MRELEVGRGGCGRSGGASLGKRQTFSTREAKAASWSSRAVRNIGDGMSEGGRARVGVEKRAVWRCGRSGDASLGKDKSFPLGKPRPRFGVAALRGT